MPDLLKEGLSYVSNHALDSGLRLGGLGEAGGEVDEGLAVGASGEGGGLAGISAFTDALDDRDLTEERNAVPVGHLIAAVLAEDVVLVLRKFLGSEPCHVLHETEDPAVYVLVTEHIHAFFHV